MHPKLIFLHIPKTSGSSQRLTLYDLYRRENVFWFGIDDSQTRGAPFSYDTVRHSAVLGGHKLISFYPPEFDALYFSFLREPVARTCSFFAHITKLKNKHEVKDAADNYALWIKRGIDPDSIVNSLANCQEFRRQVLNYQCRYLSRYNPDFEGARRTLEETACVIGTTENTMTLNRYLAEKLKWIDIPEKWLNQGGADTLDDILQEPGAGAAIHEIVQEDIRLYKYINDSHLGLYTNIAEPEHFFKRLSSDQFPSAISAEEATLRYLSIYSKGYAGLREDNHGEVSLVIANLSHTDIDHQNFPELNLRFQVLCREGKVLYSKISPIPLTATIPAHEQLITNLKFDIPQSQRVSATTLKIDLVINQTKSIAILNPLHAASATLVSVP